VRRFVWLKVMRQVAKSFLHYRPQIVVVSHCSDTVTAPLRSCTLKNVHGILGWLSICRKVLCAGDVSTDEMFHTDVNSDRFPRSIVGRDFLPRGVHSSESCFGGVNLTEIYTIGNGIITRRPLILQLIHTPTPAVAKNQDGSDSSTTLPLVQSPSVSLNTEGSLSCHQLNRIHLPPKRNMPNSCISIGGSPTSRKFEGRLKPRPSESPGRTRYVSGSIAALEQVDI